MPLVRYETGDHGYLFSHAHLSQVLRHFNYEEYVPRSRRRSWPSPVESIGLRLSPGNRSGRSISSLAPYSSRTVASRTTGQFQATTIGERLRIQVQMRSQVDAGRMARSSGAFLE